MQYRSQNLEAKIVAEYFGEFKGTLLDVGANDGITFSNSYDLIKAGWKGFLVEPSPKAFAKLSVLHPNDIICINDAIGLENKSGILHESGPHLPDQSDIALLSGMEIDDKWKHLDYQPVEIRIITIEYLLNLYKIKQIDFITIDCEGMDWHVLKQIDLKSLGCRCVCIEWNRESELKNLYWEYCKKFGMKQIYESAENLIFAL